MNIFIPIKNRCRFFVLVISVASILVGCANSDEGLTDPSNDPPPSPGQGAVSFQQHVAPLMQAYGCVGCHGGNGGFYVATPQGQVRRDLILAGGDHGPAVDTAIVDNSILLKKLRPNPPFGDRMPQGGPFMPDSSIDVIRRWIDEGAQNN